MFNSLVFTSNNVVYIGIYKGNVGYIIDFIDEKTI